jgi:transcriptional regulator with XRE-family HTH domain
MQLRRLRLERGLSQERLGELSGLSYKYIGRIELSKAEPGAEALVRLARALGVSVGKLFDTITPMDSTGHQFSPADLEAVSASLKTLTSIVDRICAGQPPPLPRRAPRRSHR